MAQSLNVSKNLLGILSDSDVSKKRTDFNERPLSEEGFKWKLRLDNSKNIGIVCASDLSVEFKFNTLCPLNKDVSSVRDVTHWRGLTSNKTKTREFKTRPCLVDSDCYFMVVEKKGDNNAVVVPISQYYLLEPHVAQKQRVDVQDGFPQRDDLGIEERLKKIAKADESPVDDKNRMTDRSDQFNHKTGVKNNIGWDYERDNASDDEELYPAVTQQIETSEDNPFNQQRLSLYGYRMKNLLIQQEEREVDEELKQYSDDEDGSSQVSSSSRTTKSQDNMETPTKKAKLDGKGVSLEERVLRFLKQNMGRVTVKSILEHFSIKEKNDDFRIIQKVIQKKCTMTSEEHDGKKIKFIVCRPEFLK